MATTKTDIAKLYIAMFNRAPESEGLDYWYAKAQNGESMVQIANQMLTAAKGYSADYPQYANLDTTDADSVKTVIEDMYKILFNKDYSTDPSGIDHWVKDVVTNGQDLGTVVVSLITAAEDYLNSSDTAAKAAAQTFENRVQAGTKIANQIEKADLNGDGQVDTDEFAVFQGALKAVTDDPATIDTGVSQANQAVSDLLNPNHSYELTVGADTINGTSADDTIKGLVALNSINGGNQDTLTSIDTIDGGDGNDTLIAQTLGGNLGPTISNVETIDFKAFGALGAAVFNMANVTGLEKFVNDGSIAGLTLSHVGNLIDLEVKNVNNKITSVNYSNSALSSLTDNQNLIVNNVTNNAVIDFNSGYIETLTVDSEGSANKVKLKNVDKINTLTVKGDADLTTQFDTTAVTALKTVDASAATGNLKLDLSNAAASDMSVTTGAGDDKVTVDNLDNKDTINLGDGSDTLVIKNSAAATTTVNKAITMTGVETAQFIVSGGNATYNMSGATDLTNIELGAQLGGFGLSLKKLVASADTVDYNAYNGATTATTLTSLNYNLADASGTNDSLTINVTNKDANGNLIPINDGNQISANVTANGIENITVSTDKLADNSAGTDARSADGGFGLNLTDSDLQSLTLKGETLIDAQTGAMKNLNTIDASQASGGVILDVAAAKDANTTPATSKKVTITTGDGNDYVQNILGEVATTVNTGAGNDVITAQGTAFVEKVTIDAGAGDDKIDISAQTSAGVDKKITTGDGVDTITVKDSDDSIEITDFTAGNGGDKFDLATNNATDGTNTLVNFEKIDSSATAAANNDGLVVVTNTVVDSNSDGNITLNEILSGAGASFAAAGDTMYVVYSDGTDAYFAKAVEVGGNGVDAADTVTTIATFDNIDDASVFVVDNFADFLA